MITEVCVVEGCDWGDDGKGNTVGKPMCGQGSWRPECRVNWMSSDPEDREPYADYLRDLTRPPRYLRGPERVE